MSEPSRLDQHHNTKMTASARKVIALYFLLSMVLVIVDQLTKLWIVNDLQLFQDINILPIFDITHVRNYGAAFSFLSDAGGWQRWFFTSISLIVSILLGYWMCKTPPSKKYLLVAYSLILGGAVGNLLDRMMLGYVVDFLHFYYDEWHFPAFNVADIAISIGAGFLILDSWLEYRNDLNSRNAENQQLKKNETPK